MGIYRRNGEYVFRDNENILEQANDLKLISNIGLDLDSMLEDELKNYVGLQSDTVQGEGVKLKNAHLKLLNAQPVFDEERSLSLYIMIPYLKYNRTLILGKDGVIELNAIKDVDSVKFEFRVFDTVLGDFRTIISSAYDMTKYFSLVIVKNTPSYWNLYVNNVLIGEIYTSDAFDVTLVDELTIGSPRADDIGMYLDDINVYRRIADIDGINEIYRVNPAKYLEIDDYNISISLDSLDGLTQDDVITFPPDNKDYITFYNFDTSYNLDIITKSDLCIIEDLTQCGQTIEDLRLYTDEILSENGYTSMEFYDVVWVKDIISNDLFYLDNATYENNDGFSISSYLPIQNITLSTGTVSYPTNSETVNDIFGDSSILATYLFNNTINDLGGLFSNTYEGNTITLVTGKFNKALHFPTNERVKVDAKIIDNTDTYSISAWVYLTANGEFGIFTQNESGWNQYGIEFIGYNNSIGFSHVRDDSASTNNSVATPQILNEWHHYVATRNGTSIKLYQDGELVDSNNLITNTIINSTNTYIGSYINGNSNTNTDCTLDQIRVFNKELSQSEVQSLFYEAGDINLTKALFDVTDETPTVEIDLGEPKYLKSFSTQAYISNYITSYSVSISYNKLSWTYLSTIYKGNTDLTSIVTNELGRNLKIQYIRIHPRTWVGEPKFYFDVNTNDNKSLYEFIPVNNIKVTDEVYESVDNIIGGDTLFGKKEPTAITDYKWRRPSEIFDYVTLETFNSHALTFSEALEATPLEYVPPFHIDDDYYFNNYDNDLATDVNSAVVYSDIYQALNVNYIITLPSYTVELFTDLGKFDHDYILKDVINQEDSVEILSDKNLLTVDDAQNLYNNFELYYFHGNYELIPHNKYTTYRENYFVKVKLTSFYNDLIIQPIISSADNNLIVPDESKIFASGVKVQQLNNGIYEDINVISYSYNGNNLEVELETGVSGDFKVSSFSDNVYTYVVMDENTNATSNRNYSPTSTYDMFGIDTFGNEDTFGTNDTHVNELFKEYNEDLTYKSVFDRKTPEVEFIKEDVFRSSNNLLVIPNDYGVEFELFKRVGNTYDLVDSATYTSTVVDTNLEITITSDNESFKIYKVYTPVLNSNTLSINDTLGDGSGISTYKFDNDYLDISGNHNGTVQGTPLFGDGFNSSSLNSVEFIDNTRIDIPEIVSDTFTVSVWVFRQYDFPHYQPILGFNYNDTTSQYSYDWFIGLHANIPAYVSSRSGNEVPFGTWAHLIFSIDSVNKNMTTYINGSLNSIMSISSSSFTTQNKINQIGSFTNSSFVGTYSRSLKIDQLKILNRLVTEDDIKILRLDLEGKYTNTIDNDIEINGNTYLLRKLSGSVYNNLLLPEDNKIKYKDSKILIYDDLTVDETDKIIVEQVYHIDENSVDISTIPSNPFVQIIDENFVCSVHTCVDTNPFNLIVTDSGTKAYVTPSGQSGYFKINDINSSTYTVPLVSPTLTNFDKYKLDINNNYFNTEKIEPYYFTNLNGTDYLFTDTCMYINNWSIEEKETTICNVLSIPNLDESVIYEDSIIQDKIFEDYYMYSEGPLYKLKLNSESESESFTFINTFKIISNQITVPDASRIYENGFELYNVYTKKLIISTGSNYVGDDLVIDVIQNSGEYRIMPLHYTNTNQLLIPDSKGVYLNGFIIFKVLNNTYTKVEPVSYSHSGTLLTVDVTDNGTYKIILSYRVVNNSVIIPNPSQYDETNGFDIFIVKDSNDYPREYEYVEDTEYKTYVTRQNTSITFFEDGKYTDVLIVEKYNEPLKANPMKYGPPFTILDYSYFDMLDSLNAGYNEIDTDADYALFSYTPNFAPVNSDSISISTGEELDLYNDTGIDGINIDVNLEKDKWYSLVVNKNNNNIEFFIDGVSIGELNTYGHDDVTGDEIFEIGSRIQSKVPNDYFQGSVDNLYYFNKPIGYNNIKDILNNTILDIDVTNNNLYSTLLESYLTLNIDTDIISDNLFFKKPEENLEHYWDFSGMSFDTILDTIGKKYGYIEKGIRFVNEKNILDTDGAVSIDVIDEGGTLIVLANSNNIEVIKLIGENYVNIQTINQSNVSEVTLYKSNKEVYLVALVLNSTEDGISNLYKINEKGLFAKVDEFRTYTPTGSTNFIANGSNYILVTNYFRLYEGYYTNSYMYKLDSDKMVLIQDDIFTGGAISSTNLIIDDKTYVLIANRQLDSVRFFIYNEYFDRIIDSSIYDIVAPGVKVIDTFDILDSKFVFVGGDETKLYNYNKDTSQFELFQEFELGIVSSSENFTVNGITYLIIGVYEEDINGELRNDLRTIIYYYDNVTNSFIEYQNLDSFGVSDLKVLSENNINKLYITNEKNGEHTIQQLKEYTWSLSNGIINDSLFLDNDNLKVNGAKANSDMTIGMWINYENSIDGQATLYEFGNYTPKSKSSLRITNDNISFLINNQTVATVNNTFDFYEWNHIAVAISVNDEFISSNIYINGILVGLFNLEDYVLEDYVELDYFENTYINNYAESGYTEDGYYVTEFQGVLKLKDYITNDYVEDSNLYISRDVFYNKHTSIGSSIDNGNKFKGYVDEIVVYSKFLNKEEIISLYNDTKLKTEITTIPSGYKTILNAGELSSRYTGDVVLGDGKFGSSIVNDGVSDYISLPEVNLNNDKTISIWFIIDEENYVNFGLLSQSETINGFTNVDYSVSIESGLVKLEIFNNIFDIAYNVKPFEWHNIVLVIGDVTYNNEYITKDYIDKTSNYVLSDVADDYYSDNYYYDSMIFDLKIDNYLVDSTNHSNITNSNVSYIYGADNRQNTAVEFNGDSDEYISTDKLFLTGRGFSVSCKIRVDSLDNMTLFNINDSSDSNKPLCRLYLNIDGSLSIKHTVNNNSVEDEQIITTPADTLFIKKWVNVIVSFDNNNIEVFIDKNMVFSFTSTYDIIYNDNMFLTISEPYSISVFDIYSLHILDRPVNSSLVEKLFNNNSSITDMNMKFYIDAELVGFTDKVLERDKFEYVYNLENKFIDRNQTRYSSGNTFSGVSKKDIYQNYGYNNVWEFNDSLLGSDGSDNLINTPFEEYVIGNFDKALNIKNNDEIVDKFIIAPHIHSDIFSVSVWVKESTFFDESVIMSSCLDCNNAHYWKILRTTNGLALVIDDRRIDFDFTFSVWHNIVLTNNSEIIKIIVDGDTKLISSDNITFNNTELYIGNKFNGFEGAVSNLRTIDNFINDNNVGTLTNENYKINVFPLSHEGTVIDVENSVISTELYAKGDSLNTVDGQTLINTNTDLLTSQSSNNTFAFGFSQSDSSLEYTLNTNTESSMSYWSYNTASSTNNAYINDKLYIYNNRLYFEGTMITDIDFTLNEWTYIVINTRIDYIEVFEFSSNNAGSIGKKYLVTSVSESIIGNRLLKDKPFEGLMSNIRIFNEYIDLDIMIDLMYNDYAPDIQESLNVNVKEYKIIYESGINGRTKNSNLWIGKTNELKSLTGRVDRYIEYDSKLNYSDIKKLYNEGKVVTQSIINEYIPDFDMNVDYMVDNLSNYDITGNFNNIDIGIGIETKSFYVIDKDKEKITVQDLTLNDKPSYSVTLWIDYTTQYITNKDIYAPLFGQIGTSNYYFYIKNNYIQAFIYGIEYKFDKELLNGWNSITITLKDNTVSCFLNGFDTSSYELSTYVYNDISTEFGSLKFGYLDFLEDANTSIINMPTISNFKVYNDVLDTIYIVKEYLDISNNSEFKNPLFKGIYAYYSFDSKTDIVLDETGKYNASMVDGSYVKGKNYSALSLDLEPLVIPDIPFKQNNSISAWVKSSTRTFTITSGLNTFTISSVGLYTDKDEVYTYDEASFKINGALWNHYVIVKDSAGYLTVYENNIEIAKTSITFDYDIITEVNTSSKVVLDDLRFHDNRLTIAEIDTLYNSNGEDKFNMPSEGATNYYLNKNNSGLDSIGSSDLSLSGATAFGDSIKLNYGSLSNLPKYVHGDEYSAVYYVSQYNISEHLNLFSVWQSKDENYSIYLDLLSSTFNVVKNNVLSTFEYNYDFELDRFYNIVLVFKDTLTVYIDGVLTYKNISIPDATLIPEVPADGETPAIPAHYPEYDVSVYNHYYTGNTSYVSGLYNEMAFYNRLLSIKEIGFINNYFNYEETIVNPVKFRDSLAFYHDFNNKNFIDPRNQYNGVGKDVVLSDSTYGKSLSLNDSKFYIPNTSDDIRSNQSYGLAIMFNLNSDNLMRLVGLSSAYSHLFEINISTNTLQFYKSYKDNVIDVFNLEDTGFSITYQLIYDYLFENSTGTDVELIYNNFYNDYEYELIDNSVSTNDFSFTDYTISSDELNVANPMKYIGVEDSIIFLNCNDSLYYNRVNGSLTPYVNDLDEQIVFATDVQAYQPNVSSNNIVYT